MHRRASSTRGADDRLRRTRVEAPRARPAAIGLERRVRSRARGRAAARRGRRTSPRSGLIRFVFFPNQPSPARRARSRSSIGPVSTYGLPRTVAPASLATRRCSSRSMRVHHVVVVVAARIARDRPARLPAAVVERDDDRAASCPAPAAACRAASPRRARGTPSRPRVPSRSHASNSGDVSAGPSVAMPTRSNPSAYACAFARRASSVALGACTVVPAGVSITARSPPTARSGSRPPPAAPRRSRRTRCACATAGSRARGGEGRGSGATSRVAGIATRRARARSRCADRAARAA